MVNDNTRILILCTGNSCRSQMAEGFFRHHLKTLGLKGAAAEVRSAGLEVHGLNLRAVQVMDEVGVDISGHRSENLQQYLDNQFDFIITVCGHAAQHCPTFPGDGERMHWPFDDPASATGSDEEILSEFRRVRDQINSRVKDWLGA